MRFATVIFLNKLIKLTSTKTPIKAIANNLFMIFVITQENTLVKCFVERAQMLFLWEKEYHGFCFV